jgi:hypothetical protein
MTEDKSERCSTRDCENEPVTDGYCAECTDISPGILDSDDGDGAPEEGHRASAVSDETDEPESDTNESPDSGSHSRAQDSSDDADPGFEAWKSAASKQSHTAVVSRRALDQHGQRGGPR